jgi:SSS family transporter
MHWLDWLIVAAYLSYLITSGIRMTKRSKEVEGYFLANRSLPWWAVGLSVMATQMSAITLVGTTGQAYADGMRFIQFYFGLPLAMVILCVTTVPFFYRAKVYTAYEYLEGRFDAKTRALTSLCFLVQRGLSCGVIIAAPAVILSIVFGWNRLATVLVIGLAMTLYTMFGGVQAVTWIDVKQMIVIFIGLFVCVFIIVGKFPAGVSLGDALAVAGAAGRLKTVDTKFDLNETYTLWSGLIGGLFLALSYFGCDQSQVQRFLTAKSVSQGRTSLLMSAFIKIPMQFLILLIGVLVFVFYQFQKPPMIFNRAEAARVESSAYQSDYAALQAEYDRAFSTREQAAVELARTHSPEARQAYITANQTLNQTRQKAVSLVKQATRSDKFTDVNYVFPNFVTTQMPVGIMGLIIAAIFAAAMSASSGELNALATTTVMDVYRRHFRKAASESHYLMIAKLATGFWGLFACVVALFASQQGSLIEVVNKFGSFFYGSMLGVFVLAIGTRRATGTGAFVGMLCGLAAVAVVSNYSSISFLWYNLIGCVVVVVVGMLLSFTNSSKQLSAKS